MEEQKKTEKFVTKPCPHCGAEIPVLAFKCPRCNKELPRRDAFRGSSLWSGVLVTTVVVVLVLGFCLFIMLYPQA